MPTNKSLLILCFLFVYGIGCNSPGTSTTDCVRCLNEDPYFKSCDETTTNTGGERVCIDGDDVRECLGVSDCCSRAGEDIVYGNGRCVARCYDDSECNPGERCGEDGVCGFPAPAPSWAASGCRTGCAVYNACAPAEAINEQECIASCERRAAAEPNRAQYEIECVSTHLSNSRCDEQGFYDCVNSFESGPGGSTTEPEPMGHLPSGAICMNSGECISGACAVLPGQLEPICVAPCESGECNPPFVCSQNFCIPPE